MDNVLDQISPYLSLGMIAVLAVFVVLGLLFGLVRGVKRAGLRLAIWISLLLIVFFVTPLIANSLLGLNINIAGKTPGQHADELSDKLVVWLQDQFGDYIVPFQDYIKDYAYGIVLAVINLVLFFVMYFVVKMISWVIYAIVAHFAAPKRDHDGKKIKKHAGWGMLVGAFQGVLLFVFLMMPVNGVIGVVNQAAAYQAMQAEDNQSNTQTAAVAETTEENNDEVNVSEILDKFSGSLTVYSNVMKYSGLQFVSNKAFEYQMTVRVEKGEDINLVHDINSGLELAMDAKAFGQVVSKFQDMYHDKHIDLTVMSASDCKIMRQFINKTFDLQILSVADRLLGDLDKILATRYNDDETLLAGTEIYEHSIYGSMIKKATTQREFTYELAEGETAPTNYAQYAAGLRSIVNYVADRKLDLVRDDLINTIDFLEVVGTYKITYQGLDEPETLAATLLKDNLGVKDYLDLSISQLSEDVEKTSSVKKSKKHQGVEKYTAGTPLINVLGDRLSQFAIVQMLGLKDVENLLVYGKVMDNQFSNDQDVKNLVDGLIPLFLGEKAFNQYDDEGVKTAEGNWEKLGDVLLDVAGVIRDYVTILDDVEKIKNDLKANDPSLSETSAQTKALLQYLANLVISKEYYETHKDTEFAGLSYSEIKYQKIDQVVDALYRLVNEFEPVKTFLQSKLAALKDGEEGSYIQMLIDMLNGTKEEWKSTLHNIVNVADIINNSKLGDLIDAFQNAGSVEDLTKQLVNAINDVNVSADDVADMLTNLLDVPEVNDKIQESLDSILDKAAQDSATLEELFGEDYTAVQTDIKDLKQTLQDINKATPEEQETMKTELKESVNDLWQSVRGKLNTTSDESEAN